MAEPRLMPTPKSSSVPQLMRSWTSFQVMMPMPGIIIKVTATIVVEDVSNGWTIFSVAQKKSSTTEMNSSFFSSVFIGPSAESSCAIFSRPPGISSISGGRSFKRTK